jgi:hypothetical protein
MSKMNIKVEWLKSEWLKRSIEQRRTEYDILEFKYFVQRTNPEMLNFNDLIDDTNHYLKTILELEKSASEKLANIVFQTSGKTLKPNISTDELETFLARPAREEFTVDSYFPLRVWIIGIAGLIWFFRLTVFTNEIATDLFTNSAVREFMVPALFFRAWVIIVSICVLFWSYKSSRYPAIAFGFLLVASIFNLLFDINIFYTEKLANQDTKISLFITFRIFITYLLFISMRNAKRIPSGNDRWNLFLPFKKHDQSQNSAY